ncbi:hypothetical protein [Paenibacillus monticola]|uniref:Adhesin domain-containing protein n=1 Tax=Paenibacillus monticola TaxID=2666075 RepID=A0A7X2HB38_9BACL|nr:hypothetical protein [Paenibacillus monticola]MRN56775.1 hypothetical protein [Paenibacillus monticola]
MLKNHKLIMLAAVAVLSTTLLASCRPLPGKVDANHEAEQNIGEIIKQEIGQTTANVEQTVQNTADKVKDELTENSISKELSASLAIDSASVLSIDNAVGTIEITSIAGDNINVSATIMAHNVSAHSTDRQDILDHAEVSIQINGNTLEVSTTPKESAKKDLWTWAQDKYGYSDFSINYIIEIPANLNRYQINNRVGEISLHNLEGTYHIVSNVGAISIEGAKVTGKSSVESNTGSIHLGITDMKNGSSLKVKSDIGSLTAILANDLKCSLDIESELGQITGATNGTSELGGGGPLLSLSTQIGAITVQQ